MRSLASWSMLTANSMPFRDSLRGLPLLRPRAGGVQARLGALADDAAFKFGEGGGHVKNQLPPGVVVAMRFCRLLKPMLRCSRAVTISRRSFKDRPSRSSFHTASTFHSRR
jgi:hypothetical protein